MEVLSEHQCQGWLEGYLLTGRHGMFASYEAFIHIVDSMVNQHAKWLKVSEELEWRRPLASLNYLLSSHVWRQDHNGFSHQDPGFIDHVVNKKAEFVRVYLPPDANTLLSTYDHCLRSRHYINVVVAGKQPNPNWLTMDEAVVHCTRGLGIWEWAGTEEPGQDPDVVLACAGDIPTIETLAAAKILRQQVPGLKVRVINVVDLMRLDRKSTRLNSSHVAISYAVFCRPHPALPSFPTRRSSDLPLHPRSGNLGMGRHRGARAGPGRGAGLRRGHPHHRDAGRREDPEAAGARAQGAGDQRRGPDASAGRLGTPPRALAGGFRGPLRAGHPGGVRLPRLSLADPSPGLPARPPLPDPCARLQGGGHHHHALRHADAQ